MLSCNENKFCGSLRSFVQMSRIGMWVFGYLGMRAVLCHMRQTSMLLILSKCSVFDSFFLKKCKILLHLFSRDTKISATVFDQLLARMHNNKLSFYHNSGALYGTTCLLLMHQGHFIVRLSVLLSVLLLIPAVLASLHKEGELYIINGSKYTVKPTLVQIPELPQVKEFAYNVLYPEHMWLGLSGLKPRTPFEKPAGNYVQNTKISH